MNPQNEYENPIFKLEDITVQYTFKSKIITALQNISLFGVRGSTLGVVGESGCGKSTLAKTLILLQKPVNGKIFFNNQELTNMQPKELRQVRKKMQLIFQDPDSSLNPRMTIFQTLSEAIRAHRLENSLDKDKQVAELLEKVHLSKQIAHRYPHELSGGQKQRVSIARALSVEPELVICDEPLSSLDVSVRIQILDLLLELQSKQKLAYLFITHDLATLRYIAHRVAVLYLGSLVEFQSTDSLYKNPLHPYTQLLLSSVCIPDPEVEKKKKRVHFHGEPPSLLSPPTGCPFHTRCPHATSICKEQKPKLHQIETNSYVACHLYENKR